MNDIQMSMFPSYAPEYELVPRTDEPEPTILYTPEWALIGRKNRSPRYHVVKAAMGGYHGVVTMCGLRGWVIPEDDPPLAMHTCRDCAARR